VCTGEISAKEYGRTINHIRLFFEGHKSMLVKKLEREMKAAAKALEFERAGEIKKTLFGLQHIRDMALVKDDARLTTDDLRRGMRIEAYDVAHLMGQASVGVMTVVQDGRPEKESYKKFTLRGAHGGDDLSALREILKRRLGHPEWGMPDVVVTDGSDLQLSVARQVFAEADLKLLIVGVVKDSRHKAREIIGLPAGFAKLEADILLVNSEAHRFAIAFHRKRRGKEFLG
jgi:excinuclease ABC subunit C